MYPSGVDLDEEEHVERLSSTVSTEKKSQASIDDAWEARNSAQVGPHRIGAGSTP
jgi:hypothetical protein